MLDYYDYFPWTFFCGYYMRGIHSHSSQQLPEMSCRSLIVCVSLPILLCSSKKCPSPYQDYSGSCIYSQGNVFNVGTKKYNYCELQAACRELSGGRLVKQFTKFIAVSSLASWNYIGASDFMRPEQMNKNDKEGWYWDDGSRYDGLKISENPKPDDGCLQVSKAVIIGTNVVPVSCTTKYPLFCEYSSPPPKAVKNDTQLSSRVRQFAFEVDTMPRRSMLTVSQGLQGCYRHYITETKLSCSIKCVLASCVTFYFHRATRRCVVQLYIDSLLDKTAFSQWPKGWIRVRRRSLV